MSVTQYIGARYVPIFADPIAWDITQAYEALTIVYYQGNSYTSRQAVPAGIDITNTTYWALTGNYNAQIEQYRLEVQTVSSDVTELDDQMSGDVDSGLKQLIDTNSEAIASLDAQMAGTTDSELKQLIGGNSEAIALLDAQMAGTTDSGLKQLIVSDSEPLKVFMNHGSYAVTLAQCGDDFFIFDCGNNDEASDIRLFLNAHGVTKIAAVIISHFHYDHYSGFATIAEYCDSDTDIFVQMETPASFVDEYSLYVAGRDAVNAIIQSNGLKAAQVPVQGATHTYDSGARLTFWNTNPSYVSAYYNSFANSTVQEAEDDVTVAHPSLNNFSLCALLEFNGNSYLDCGDLEGEGQREVLPFMRPVTIAKHPHHFVNRQGIFQWYQKVAPQVWIVSNNMQSISETSITTSAMSYYYLFRYQLYTQDKTPIIANVGTPLSVVAVAGDIKDYLGYLASAYMFPTNQVTVAALLPPNLYKDNPYWLMKACTLDDFDDIRIAANAFVKPTFYGNYTWGSIADWPFVEQIYELMLYNSSYSTHKTFRVDFVNLPRITDYNAEIGYNIVELYTNFAFDSYANGSGYRRYSHDNTPKELAPTNAYASGSTIPAGEYEVIRYAKQLIAVTSNNVIVPLLKTNSVSSTGDTSSSYAGMVYDTTNGVIVHVKISASGALVCQNVNVATGGLTSNSISKIRVIN